MKREKKRNWGALIREQLASGESQISFCRARGLPVATFQYQKSKGAHLENKFADFVPIIGGEKEERIEITVGSEIRLYFPQNISAERLSEVVRCLSSK